MAVAGPVQDVGQHHGVVDGADGQAFLGQDVQVELDVVADLERAGVGQHGAQDLDGLGHRDLLGRVAAAAQQVAVALRVDVAQGHVAGLARLQRQGEADQVAGARVEAIGFRVDGDTAQPHGLGHPAAQGVGVLDEVVVDLFRWCRQGGRGAGLGGDGGPGLGLHLGDEAAELHGLQEVDQPLGVGVLDREVVDGVLDRDVVVQQHQLLGDQRLVAVLLQGLAALGLLDLGRVLQEVFQRPVLLDQLGGGLHADARHAWHVVDAVTAERLDVDHLLGRDAELGNHLVAADGSVLHGVPQPDMAVDQLHEVLVGGDDGHLVPLLDGQAGIGGDDVVGLEGLALDAGQVHGPHGVADERELRHQVLGRRRAVGLVLRVDVAAEGLAGGVEDDRDVAGVSLVQQLQQHGGEALHGVDRRAVGPRQRRQGMVGAEDEPGAVDQKEMFHGKAPCRAQT